MSSRFRTLKSDLHKELRSPHWSDFLSKRSEVPPREFVGPLLSCLPLGAEVTERAATLFGRVVARMGDESLEDARNVVRRLMWHMNEESGNIGWGIPEAFAEVLIQSPRLADEFHAILFSYIMHTGRDDNYCDHDILRRSCYRAVTHLAGARPDLAPKARPLLQAGLLDIDSVCRDLSRAGLDEVGMF